MLLCCSSVLVAPSLAACTPSDDYLNLIGGDTIGVEHLIAVPNAANDQLVAGTYLDSMLDTFSYMYLFRESTCTYVWKFRGGDSLKYPKALAWSYDQR